jgi:hypothetical protein
MPIKLNNNKQQLMGIREKIKKGSQLKKSTRSQSCGNI